MANTPLPQQKKSRLAGLDLGWIKLRLRGLLAVTRDAKQKGDTVMVAICESPIREFSAEIKARQHARQDSAKRLQLMGSEV